MLAAVLAGLAAAADRYQPSWESLVSHPNPQWFDDAKFGIYFHWGPYSVAAFDNEWYSRNMYRPEQRAYRHHMATFGALDHFGYKDFIPMFKAEHFNPDEWADLFVRAGARFAGPVAEHADGFSMWDSRLTAWNAARMGPHRDVASEMEKAVRMRGLKFMASFHHQWLWAWYPTFDADVDASNPKYEGLYGPPVTPAAWNYKSKDGLIPSAEFCRLWEDKVKEFIDRYHPDLIYFDSRLGHIGETYRLDLLAYYYNRTKETVVTYKDKDLAPGSGILDLERGRMATLAPFKWLTDDSMSWKSWCYIENDQLKTPKRLIDELVDIVSKNGNLLLDIGPKADGTIPEAVRERLLAMGRWLSVNGEAIYGTRPWEVFGEGPTEVKNGAFQEARTGDLTSADVRFTTRGQTLYAIVMGWPAGEMTIRSLAAGRRLPGGRIARIDLLGSAAAVEWRQDAAGLKLKMPAQQPGDYAFVLRISGR